MQFVERFEQISKKIKPVSNKKLVVNTLIFAGLIFLFGALWLFARRGVFDLYIANKVLATTSLVLIGSSFALSGFSYFWDFLDTKIIYRKFLGLIGFYFGLAHILVTVAFLPHKFTFPDWILNHMTSFIFAILALLIFSVMAAISNRYAVIELGGKRWRMILRIGYIAFIFIMVHFTLLKYPGWVKWFATREPFLPPLSLLEIIFAVAVIGLRVALSISLWKKRRLRQEISAEILE